MADSLALSEPVKGCPRAEAVSRSCVRCDKVCAVAQGLVLFTSAMKEGGGGCGEGVISEWGSRVNPTVDHL